jgi:hypothetical protein
VFRIYRVVKKISGRNPPRLSFSPDTKVNDALTSKTRTRYVFNGIPRSEAVTIDPTMASFIANQYSDIFAQDQLNRIAPRLVGKYRTSGAINPKASLRASRREDLLAIRLRQALNPELDGQLDDDAADTMLTGGRRRKKSRTLRRSRSPRRSRKKSKKRKLQGGKFYRTESILSHNMYNPDSLEAKIVQFKAKYNDFFLCFRYEDEEYISKNKIEISQIFNSQGYSNPVIQSGDTNGDIVFKRIKDGVSFVLDHLDTEPCKKYEYLEIKEILERSNVLYAYLDDKLENCFRRLRRI